jgi:pyruvate dehydrogenase complex dehydrogenase (E1) component
MAAAAERLPISVGFPGQLPDEDPAETQEWLESLDGLVDHARRARARALQLRSAYVTRRLSDAPGPMIAVSDWMRAVPDQIAIFVPGSWSSLGTDGSGRSDIRPALRRHFGIDALSIVLRTLEQLIARQERDSSVRDKAIGAYGLDAAGDPTTRTHEHSAR